MPLTRTFGAEADGELADEVAEGGLADVVGFAAALGDDGVRGTGEHDAGVDSLLGKDLRGLVGEQVVRSDVDFERRGPLRIADDAVGRRRKERGGVDEDVDAAELADGGIERRADRLAIADVDAGPADGLFAADRGCLVGDCLCTLQIAIRNDDVGAACSAARRTTSRPMPLPPPTTRATRRLSSFSGGWRRIFASSSFQYSMRKASLGGSAT